MGKKRKDGDSWCPKRAKTEKTKRTKRIGKGQAKDRQRRGKGEAVQV